MFWYAVALRRVYDESGVGMGRDRRERGVGGCGDRGLGACCRAAFCLGLRLHVGC